LIFSLAGIVGVSPLEFTLRELLDMAVGRLRSEWERTAQISFMINAAFGKKADYKNHNPFYDHAAHAIEMTPENIELMKKEFLK